MRCLCRHVSLFLAVVRASMCVIAPHFHVCPLCRPHRPRRIAPPCPSVQSAARFTNLQRHGSSDVQGGPVDVGNDASELSELTTDIEDPDLLAAEQGGTSISI